MLHVGQPILNSRRVLWLFRLKSRRLGELGDLTRCHQMTGDLTMGCLTWQWIGLRENLQESPILNGKIYGFL